MGLYAYNEGDICDIPIHVVDRFSWRIVIMIFLQLKRTAGRILFTNVIFFGMLRMHIVVSSNSWSKQKGIAVSLALANIHSRIRHKGSWSIHCNGSVWRPTFLIPRRVLHHLLLSVPKISQLFGVLVNKNRRRMT